MFDWWTGKRDVMKLLVVVVVASLLAAVYGSAVHSSECGALERLKVKHQWFEAYGHGHARIIFGLKIWNK